MKTFSVEEYADQVLGGHSPADIQWLVKRFRGESKPQLPAYKAGRRWRGTEEDIAKAIELLRPRQVGVPELPSPSGLTRTSARRLMGRPGGLA